MTPFDVKKGDIISITGAGGKTTLMFSLAKTLVKKGSVLIATTTKIFKPKNEDFIFIYPEEICNYSPQDNFIHIFCPKINNNKIESASFEDLNELKNHFDYILIEADGSCGKPLKGWKDNEPCIPSFANKTISVIDINCIGKNKNDTNIHRYELYKNQFTSECNKISEKDLFNYITHAPLFKNFSFSEDNKYLFFNKIYSENEFEIFFNLANKLNFKNIFWGSAIKNEYYKFKTVTPIVLAAGFSKRFNGDKLKALLKSGNPILEETLNNISTLNFKEKILIGKDKFSFDLALKYKFKYFKNSSSHLGQSQSVILGSKNATSDAFMFIPGDMPFLTKNTFLKVIFEFEQKDMIIVPTLNDRPSPPIIFPRRFQNELLLLSGDNGGREVLKKNKYIKIYVTQSQEFSDIDTQEDLKNI